MYVNNNNIVNGNSTREKYEHKSLYNPRHIGKQKTRVNRMYTAEH